MLVGLETLSLPRNATLWIDLVLGIIVICLIFCQARVLIGHDFKELVIQPNVLQNQIRSVPLVVNLLRNSLVKLCAGMSAYKSHKFNLQKSLTIKKIVTLCPIILVNYTQESWVNIASESGGKHCFRTSVKLWGWNIHYHVLTNKRNKMLVYNRLRTCATEIFCFFFFFLFQ